MKSSLKYLILFCCLTLINCKNNNVKKQVEQVAEVSNTEKNVRSHNKVMYVSAKNGLNYRKKPKGKIISKLEFNKSVEIIYYTGIKENIEDEGSMVSGEWVGFLKEKDTVYVFDGFLSNQKNITSEVRTEKVEEKYDGFIFIPGQYHGDEIPKNLSTKNWFGIFKDNNQYFLKETSIELSTVHDIIVDQKGENTGKKIVSKNSEECFLLLNNIKHLSERKIDYLDDFPNVIHPNNPFKFTFKENQYQLFSTAENFSPLNEEKNYFQAKKYKLYLEKITNNNISRQLIVDEDFFNDDIIDILFLGDIDGDGILDLLIDTSNHYNSTEPTLYLSRESGENKIVKIVGKHTSVGC